MRNGDGEKKTNEAPRLYIVQHQPSRIRRTGVGECQVTVSLRIAMLNTQQEMVHVQFLVDGEVQKKPQLIGDDGWCEETLVLKLNTEPHLQVLLRWRHDPTPQLVDLGHIQVPGSKYNQWGKYLNQWGKYLDNHMKQAAFLLVTILSIGLFWFVGTNYGWWQAGVVVLAVAIFITIAPIMWSFLGWTPLNHSGPWFDTASQLRCQQQRIINYYERLEGTLRFWKNKAIAYQRLHQARLIWSIVSAVSMPILVQRYDRSDIWSVVFATMLASWTGFVTLLAYTLKAEEKYQGFRQQESDFYDISRNLLDRTHEDGSNLKSEVDAYIEKVNEVRKIGRRIETNSPPSAM